MKRIRVCIGSNDGENIAATHMGDTDVFHIYDLFENGDSQLIERRSNTAKDMDHAKSDKMKEIIKIVKDVDVFVARQKSPNFVNIASKTRYQPVVVGSEALADVLSLLNTSFQEIYGCVSRRGNGELFDMIPELK